jgi:hypothetical protein
MSALSRVIPSFHPVPLRLFTGLCARLNLIYVFTEIYLETNYSVDRTHVMCHMTTLNNTTCISTSILAYSTHRTYKDFKILWLFGLSSINELYYPDYL